MTKTNNNIRKAIVLSLLLMVFLIPINVSSEEYSTSLQERIYICPPSSKILATLMYYYQTTTFGFYNFTIVEANLNILSTELIDVCVNQVIFMNNTTVLQEIFQLEAKQFNLTVDDLFQLKTYNATIGYYMVWNGICFVTQSYYTISVPPLILEIENKGEQDAIINISRNIIVDTYGFWSPEMIILSDDLNITNTDIIRTTVEEKGITWEEFVRDYFGTILIMTFMCGGLLVAAVGDKFNMW